MYKKNRSQAARALNVLSQEYLTKKAAKVKAAATSKAAGKRPLELEDEPHQDGASSDGD